MGQLLVSDSSNIYLVDPQTGTSTRIVSGLSGVGDVVYNPVSDSVFAVVGEDIVQVTATPTGYATSTFISGVSGLECLAIDAFGAVIFNEEAFVEHGLWRANLDGTATVWVNPDFFVPRHMVFAKDFSKLYVFETPENDVAMVSVPSGNVTVLASGLQFPPGGDVDAQGDVYVLEDFTSAQISRIAPDGTRTTYASQSWMNFVYDDLVCDDETGALFVTSTSGLYVLNADLTYRKLFTGSGWFGGLDRIRPGAPVIRQQPRSVVVARGESATFSVGLNAGVVGTYQWRHDGTDIPGATGASLTIPSVGSQDTGSYAVFVVTAGGAAMSAGAALSLMDFAVNPVVTLTGPVGAKYQVEFSDNLENPGTWSLLTNVTASTTWMDVVDHTASASDHRFYRVLPAP